MPIGINNAKKNPINQRINLTMKLMSLGKLFIVEEDCQTLIEALSQAVWDSKEGHEDERLDNGSTDIDTLDAFEYSLEPHLNDLKYLI